MVIPVLIFMILISTFLSIIILMRGKKYDSSKEIAPIAFRIFFNGFVLSMFVYAIGISDNTVRGIGFFGTVYAIITFFEYWQRIKKYYG